MQGVAGRNTDQCGGAPCHADNYSLDPVNHEDSAPDPNPGDTTP